MGRPRPEVPPNPFNPVFSIAVLPFYNVTNDAGAPQVVREELEKKLSRRQYSVMPLKEVDRVLRDKMGITLGHQLELTTPEEVGKTLGVDGVVYGYLLNFDDITTGVYNVKQVRAGFKLVETSSGRVMWSGGGGVKSFVVAGKSGTALTALKELTDRDNEFFSTIKGLGDIPGIREWHIIRVLPTQKFGEAAVLSLGESLVTRALGLHLKAETDVLLRRVFSSMPAGPGAPPMRQMDLPPAQGFLQLKRCLWSTYERCLYNESVSIKGRSSSDQGFL
ncbi:MAG: GNA1162 family protein [Thermodesulfobacteriota bacterium]